MKHLINLMAAGFILLSVFTLTGATNLESSNNLVFENQQKYKIVSGVIRNTGNGWELISDTAHEPLHIESVSNNNSAITIDYSFTAKKVVSFVVTPDETFVRNGLNAGSSVGLDKSLIYLSEQGTGVYSDPNEVISSKGNFWFYGIFIVE